MYIYIYMFITYVGACRANSQPREPPRRDLAISIMSDVPMWLEQESAKCRRPRFVERQHLQLSSVEHRNERVEVTALSEVSSTSGGTTAVSGHVSSSAIGSCDTRLPRSASRTDRFKFRGWEHPKYLNCLFLFSLSCAVHGRRKTPISDGARLEGEKRERR